MDRKLITLGCSFTEFSWPTWADWMGTIYPEYYNLGSGGSGNKYIFHKFCEVMNSGVLDKNTDIVIQWTSCLREDIIPRGESRYAGHGNVIHSPKFNENYVQNIFNPYQNIVETTNFIKLVKFVLDVRKINYTMFFMLNPWDGDLLGEPWNAGESSFKRSEKPQITKALKALEAEIQGNFIDDSLSMYQVTNQKESYFCYKAPNEELKVEGHPSPKTHYNYFVHNIIPYFPYLQNKLPDNTEKLLQWEAWAQLRMGEEEKFDRKPEFPSTKTRFR